MAYTQIFLGFNPDKNTTRRQSTDQKQIATLWSGHSMAVI